MNGPLTSLSTMLTKEYRIVLPLTVEEYHVAQLYMVARSSKEETGDGEGIEVLKNEPYENESGKGQYTLKRIHLASRLPGWVKTIIPSLKTLALEEEAWNAYPHCKTVYTCSFLGDKFAMSVESWHLEGNGEKENVHKLPEKEWKNVEVDFIDIGAEPIPEAEYIEAEDPAKFKSEKTGRGPLDAKDWKDQVKPVMTCYKLCKAEFKFWGFQTKVEKVIQSMGLRDVFLKAHKKLFCWIDEWFGLTIEDIRALEDVTQAELAKEFTEGQAEEENNQPKAHEELEKAEENARRSSAAGLEEGGAPVASLGVGSLDE